MNGRLEIGDYAGVLAKDFDCDKSILDGSQTDFKVEMGANCALMCYSSLNLPKRVFWMAIFDEQRF